MEIKENWQRFVATAKRKLLYAICTLILIFLSCFSISANADDTPQKLNRYFNEADNYILSHRYYEAIDYYLKGINYAEDKEKIKVWDDLGYAFLKTREIEKAKNYLEKARPVRPENFNVYLYLAVAYILNNEINLASEELKKIEDTIYFDQSWLKIISSSDLRTTDGKPLSEHEAKRLRNEKGIYVHKMAQDKTLEPLTFIQMDAFDERNEGVLYLVQGIVNKTNEEFEKAEKKLLSALDIKYDEKEVRFQLANLYLKTNKFAKAKEQLDALKKLNFAFSFPHKIRFRIYHKLKGHTNNLLQTLHNGFLKQLERGMLDESIEILEKAFYIDEQSFVVNHNLAILYFDTGDFKKAETFCARALWFNENHLGSHDLMGNIYFHQKEHDRALKEFKRILKIDEWDANTHYNLGAVYHELNDWTKAEQEWKKAIECEKKNMKTAREQDFTEKGLEYSVTVRKRPVSFLSHKSLGKLYLHLGLVGKAAAEYESAIDLKPNESEPYLDLGKIYYKMGKKKKAVICLEKYLYLGGEREKEARNLLEKLRE
ncbi:MAG: tetratricopeptide repeat protein [Candidatus Aminicenantaceae bacterium]